MNTDHVLYQNLSQISALSRPLGIVSDFTNPHSIITTSIAIVVAEVFATTTTTGIRAYTRFRVMKNGSWDDYFMILSWALYIALLSVVYFCFVHGAGRHQWDVRMIDLEWLTSNPPNPQYTLVANVLHNIVLGLVKVSICLQFLRIFVPERSPRAKTFWVIWTFLLLQVGYSTAGSLLTLFQCTPFAKAYRTSLPGHCIDVSMFLLVAGIFNLASDLVLILLPPHYVSKLQMARSRKFGVAAIFLVGLVAVASSVLRSIYSWYNVRDPEDATYNLILTGICALGEIQAGILAGNLVSFPKLYSVMGSKMSNMTGLCRGSKGDGSRTTTPPETRAAKLACSEFDHDPIFDSTGSSKGAAREQQGSLAAQQSHRC